MNEKTGTRVINPLIDSLRDDAAQMGPEQPHGWRFTYTLAADMLERFTGDLIRQAKTIAALQDELAAQKASKEAWKTKRDPVLEAQLEVANNQHAAMMAKLRTVRQHILEDGDNHYRLAEIDAILDAEPANPGCGCQSCRPITLGDMRMIVCPICGNKRCPHANNHRNACTNSNAVGQPGSSWEHVQPPGS